MARHSKTKQYSCIAVASLFMIVPLRMMHLQRAHTNQRFMQADPQLQIMDEARREKAMQLRYDERQETRSLERKNLRQVERLMWYTTDLSHLHQVFLDFTLERQTSRPFFW